MIKLIVFHEKTYAAILSDGKQEYIWQCPFDMSDLYSVDPLNIDKLLKEFPDWASAQKYLTGARMVASSKLLERIECKPESAASKGLTISESRRILVRHVIDTLLPKRGYLEALQFVHAIKSFHDLDEQDQAELKESMQDQPEEASLRLGMILKQNDFDKEWKVEQALLHINEVLIPEGRGMEAKQIIYHLLGKNYTSTPKLVSEAERLYKAAKRVNALAVQQRKETEPDFKRYMPTTPKVKVL